MSVPTRKVAWIVRTRSDRISSNLEIETQDLGICHSRSPKRRGGGLFRSDLQLGRSPLQIFSLQGP